jgi:hypothetical protein
MKFTALREIALKICGIDNDVGQMASCPSDSFIKA